MKDTRDDLARRRSRRETEALVTELRDLLEAHEAGELELEEFAFSAGWIGAKLGARACRGELVGT
jgi:hypothetical protein